MFLEYEKAESEFIALISCDDLDGKLLVDPHIADTFNAKIHSALKKSLADDDESAHLFVQRCLYKINRLKLFWDDDLKNYSNENSRFLFNLRSDIENQWSAWEEKQIVIDHPTDVGSALHDRVQEDLNPELSEDERYVRDHVSDAGYRRLLAIASLDGLVEASQLSRVLGGASSEVQLMLTRILWEEYGSGKLERKHSTFFAAMMDGMGLDSRPEAYFDLVPWEVLSNINHSFMVSEQKRKFLRYIGGLLKFPWRGGRHYLGGIRELSDERSNRARFARDVRRKQGEMANRDSFGLLLWKFHRRSRVAHNACHHRGRAGSFVFWLFE